MLSDKNEKQKSPKRRFLLILGVTAFAGFCVLGLMIMFWDKFPIKFAQPQKTLFGLVIIIYAVLRFSRLLKKDPDEQ
ncbi:hypothetical protein FFF34_011855 [Inquilinus sp. KBS0705]|nr:hypothetical protein FFF34_011855 [Inquilinus sp. KBS0705]